MGALWIKPYFFSPTDVFKNVFKTDCNAINEQFLARLVCFSFDFKIYPFGFL